MTIGKILYRFTRENLYSTISPIMVRILGQGEEALGEDLESSRTVQYSSVYYSVVEYSIVQYSTCS